MKRRTFIQRTALTTAGLSVAGLSSAIDYNKVLTNKLPRWRGFNLLDYFSPNKLDRSRGFTSDEELQWMAEWGFDFVRIPMAYPRYVKFDPSKNITPEEVLNFDESVVDEVEALVDRANKFQIHVSLDLHRAPGFCINAGFNEPYNLWQDKAAQDAFYFHWRMWAKRFAGLTPDQISFDLVNEPPKNTNVERYIEIVRAVVKGIREEDPERLIVVDGKDIGRYPVMGIEDLNVVQSTRGYDPMSVSHYTATWVPDDEFETFNKPTWPLKGDDGKIWDKQALKEKLINSWKPLVDQGVQVHVGEWGCYNQTPHDVCLSWMEDILSLWKEANWGQSMWNLKGAFGILNSERKDVNYEDYKGHKLDRKMLELLKRY